MKSRILFAILAVTVAGCAVAPAADETTPPPAEEEVTAQNACSIRASLLGAAAGMGSVALACGMAALPSGGVTLVCSAPAGVIAGIAAGTAGIVSLAAQANCGGRNVDRNTRVTVNVNTSGGCTPQENARRTADYKQYCGETQYDGSLQCTNSSGACFYKGAEAARRATKAQNCADKRAEALKCFTRNDPGYAGHERAIRDAETFARNCRTCAQQR
jgi:glucose/arabinose dehydrogenase